LRTSRNQKDLHEESRKQKFFVSGLNEYNGYRLLLYSLYSKIRLQKSFGLCFFHALETIFCFIRYIRKIRLQKAFSL